MIKDVTDKSYKTIVNDIGNLLEQGRVQAAKKVNTILVDTYWYVGQRIVEFEQGGKIKAEYGKELLLRLSKDLKVRYGKGFSRSNLQYMRLLYTCYPKRQTLSGKLSWSHYVELLSISDDISRSFYEKQCIAEKWSVRELKRQRKHSPKIKIHTHSKRCTAFVILASLGSLALYLAIKIFRSKPSKA